LHFKKKTIGHNKKKTAIVYDEAFIKSLEPRFERIILPCI